MNGMSMNMTDLAKGMAAGAVLGTLVGILIGKKKRRMSCMIKKLIKTIGAIAEIALP